MAKFDKITIKRTEQRQSYNCYLEEERKEVDAILTKFDIRVLPSREVIFKNSEYRAEDCSTPELMFMGIFEVEISYKGKAIGWAYTNGDGFDVDSETALTIYLDQLEELY